MAKFNGYKNWNHWNVSLWLHNEEVLYRDMLEVLSKHKNKTNAARELLTNFRDYGITSTPDGAPYSVSSIRTAMIGLE